MKKKKIYTAPKIYVTPLVSERLLIYVSPGVDPNKEAEGGENIDAKPVGKWGTLWNEGELPNYNAWED